VSSIAGNRNSQHGHNDRSICLSRLYRTARIVIPNTVTTIGVYTFFRCTSLKAIQLPNSLTSIGGDAFSHCSSLKNIQIPESVVSIQQSAFCKCLSLTSIRLPNSLTSIGAGVFFGCRQLSTIELPHGITSIPNVSFLGCSSLTTMEIPVSVRSIGANAFHSCFSVETIKIPGTVTEIGDEAFAGCGSLRTVRLLQPSPSLRIGRDAFRRCSLLEATERPARLSVFESDVKKTVALVFVVVAAVVGEIGWVMMGLLIIPPLLLQHTFLHSAVFSDDFPLIPILRFVAQAKGSCHRAEIHCKASF
jgi:hypothetical protein